MLLTWWVVMYGVVGDDALPGGNLFAILVIFAASVPMGHAASLVGLPPLLGMMLVRCKRRVRFRPHVPDTSFLPGATQTGFVLRNVPGIDIGKDLNSEWSSALRKGALVVILTRAGLGLDTGKIRRVGAACLRLSVIPNVTEAIVDGMLAIWLFDMPWEWGFLVGCVPELRCPRWRRPRRAHSGIAQVCHLRSVPRRGRSVATEAAGRGVWHGARHSIPGVGRCLP